MLETELKVNDEEWFSKIESPEIVSDVTSIEWDDEADLVVLGLGGAGVSAANEALDHGCCLLYTSPSPRDS